MRMQRTTLWLPALSLSICLLSSGMAAAEDIRIALRANKGAQKGLEKWQATADYLSEKIPGYRFVLIPYENNSALNQAISRGEHPFCLTNPASAIEHKIRYQTQPIATLVNKRQGQGYTRFGSVVFTRSDRDDINNFQDLKGNTFMGVDELGFGGWRVAWRELLLNDINPYSDFEKLLFAGGKQQKVVYAVRDGKADAGSVRTDMLERMASKGTIRLEDFKVLNNKVTEGFPFLHSTELYPEWLFSVSGDVDDQLKTKVISALYSLQPESEAATRGKYIGWISPLDYTPVEELLRELNIGPYHASTADSFDYLVEEYGHYLALGIGIVSVLLVILLHVTRLNRRLRTATAALKIEMNSRKTLEQQLMHTQKMESLGQLTGGIAHDFNNMLAIIMGFTELAQNSGSAKQDAKLRKHLGQISDAGNKAISLVQQMLAFSRAEGHIDNARIIAVSRVIEEAHQLLRPLLPTNIDLIIKHDELEHELYIEASPVMINQVLMNLCINARDAITGSHGTITIDTQAIEHGEGKCSSCHQPISGAYIAIEIEDTGSGIDAISRERLFEPFYSTKEIGKGSGMGLSMAHGIIHQHGGHIQLDSHVGKGTKITLLLPRHSDSSASEHIEQLSDTRKTPVDPTPSHILIVDDEISITIYLRELLEQAGHRVTSFNDSQQALDFFETQHDDIDLVLSDQSMPRLPGTELASKMFAISAEIPVILCTGFSENVDEESAIINNIRAYLNKPIQSDQLMRTIERLTTATADPS